jgi:thiol-disulfide isomerase/thioredoxin
MAAKLFLSTFFSVLLFTCQAQNARLIKLPELQKLMRNQEKRITVFNFWATWCGPCIKELPLFETLSKERKDVNVMLISMDLDLDPDPEKVWKFVQRKKISSTVYILDERNPTDWIEKIDAAWTGALPATLIVNPMTGKRTFIEHELKSGELEKLIERIQ